MQKNYINRILVLNHQGIGDIIHMLPLLENIRATYPNAYVTLICQYLEQKVLLKPGLVNEYIPWKNLIKQEKKRLRKEKFDIGFLNVVTNPIKGIIYLSLVLGCRIVVSEYFFSSFSSKFRLVESNPRIHRVDRNLRLSDAALLARISSEPDIKSAFNAVKNDLYIQHVRSMMSGKAIIGICMGSAPTGARKGLKKVCKDVKQWPLENIIKLCQRLINEGYDVILLGGKMQQYISKEAIKIVNPLLHDFIGICSLVESMELISVCDLCVGVDTGLMHMSAALGKKTITLFGPTSPVEFHPYSENNISIGIQLQCEPCYGKSTMYDCQSNDCMKGITVDMVFDTCERSLLQASRMKEEVI